MANLKELRNKIGVVLSTRKVTAAMKLVAGVKFRHAEAHTLASRPYAIELGKVLSKLRADLIEDGSDEVTDEVFVGREEVSTEMLIIFSSYKGLCGNFNYLIGKFIAQAIDKIHAKGHKIIAVSIGNKIQKILKDKLGPDDCLESLQDFYRDEDLQANSENLARRAIERFRAGEVDKVSLIYTHYFSSIKHEVKIEPLLPIEPIDDEDPTDTIFEPNIQAVLDSILPYNVMIQIYQAALESVASEQGARMIAMDNATRNADEMLSDLKIKYNRTRQYSITQELTEIVSGAQAISEG